MKIKIIAFGIFKNPFEKQIFDNFASRLKAKVILKELEFKHTKNLPPDEIKFKEGELIIKNLDKETYLISLDEFGRQFNSIDFAKKIADINLNGYSNITFVIGGALGLSKNIIERSNLTISLSKMTLPHMLARIFLIEQIYRAQTINSNHPYHRQ